MRPPRDALGEVHLFQFRLPHIREPQSDTALYCPPNTIKVCVSVTVVFAISVLLIVP